MPLKAGPAINVCIIQIRLIPRPIRTSTYGAIPDPIPTGSQDDPYVNPNAKGFRLPTSDEWYQAARYIDGTKYYPDDYASGADATYNYFF